MIWQNNIPVTQLVKDSLFEKVKYCDKLVKLSQLLKSIFLKCLYDLNVVFNYQRVNLLKCDNKWKMK